MAAVKLKWSQMALPQIREILAKDADPKMRSAALDCLGKVEAEPKDYVVNMMKYLKEDKDFGVQGTALALLAQYAQDAAPAVKPLQDRLLELREANKEQDPGNIRSGILNTIVAIDQGQTLPSSLEALEKDPAVSVKLTAANRIMQSGRAARPGPSRHAGADQGLRRIAQGGPQRRAAPQHHRRALLHRAEAEELHGAPARNAEEGQGGGERGGRDRGAVPRR